MVLSPKAVQLTLSIIFAFSPDSSVLRLDGDPSTQSIKAWGRERGAEVSNVGLLPAASKSSQSRSWGLHVVTTLHRCISCHRGDATPQIQ